ncbi:putative acetylcholinesterase [Apostichopus japonicus]|uniref:Carboxylic ester hydrolase n=1 Tax=Stichopus japonicus TaxID=307972 RepID=A0A2G8KIE0_STIJA|nr:putative acetylcholinesterase [Apostichopus japonicus]
MYCVRVLIVIFSYFCKVHVTAAEDVLLELGELGSVLGRRELFEYTLDPYQLSREVYVFRGIPFAEVPTGQLRFAKPKPKQPWGGVWNGTHYRNMCHQFIPSFSRLDAPPQDEDCLHLNIWSRDIYNGSQYPVMLWIHGGAFILGSALNRLYEGDTLAAYNDVVVVTINYRVNGFGFLATGDNASPGNYGLWDQQLAMRWVHDHISKFGGDPNRITIFGQSAGGASVGFQLMAQDSWPLYQRAILMSGSMTVPWGSTSDIERVREKAFEIGEEVGCINMVDSVQLLDCLRNVDAKELTRVFLTTPFGPVIDNDFIPGDPKKLLQQGMFKNCSIMLGTTKDEGDLRGAFTFADKSLEQDPYCGKLRFDRILSEYAELYGTEFAAKAVEFEYVDWAHADNKSANYFRNFIDIETDENFLCPIDETARAFLRKGATVFRWMFSYIPTYSVYPPIPKWKGSSHADDIELVFGNAFQDQYYNRREYPDKERVLSLDMQRYYTNFAKTGNPNEGGDNDGVEGNESYWHEYTLPEMTFKELNEGLPDIKAYRASFCRLWNHQLPKLVTFTGIYSSFTIVCKYFFA